MGARVRQRAFQRNDTRDRVLAFIASFFRANGYAPSNREICEGVGIASTSTAHFHIESLEREGRIARRPGGNRTIVVVGESGECLSCGGRMESAWRFCPSCGYDTTGDPRKESEAADEDRAPVPIETRECSKCGDVCIGCPHEFKGDPFVCERCNPKAYTPYDFFLRKRKAEAHP